MYGTQEPEGEGIMTLMANPISRRNMLGATAAGSLVTAATLARAQTAESMPEPKRSGHGGTNPGPKNPARGRQNPDLISPPATDHGTLPNLRFSFDDSHIRIESGGWTRQVTQRELGISKNIAGVNMRLNTGGVRELHWHKAAEWSYMLVDDVGVGDLWYFPSGIPHSIQGLEPDGAEFLLVFDNGDFDEDNTFLLSDWITFRRKSWPRTSACRPQPLRMSPIRGSSTSFPRRYPDRSPPIRLRAPRKSRGASVIA